MRFSELLKIAHNEYSRNNNRVIYQEPETAHQRRHFVILCIETN